MAYRNGEWTRGTSNADQRGNTAQRRKRKLWLIEKFGWPDPVDPMRGLVLCWRCEVPMTFEDITVDRWPIAGCDGGTYAWDNIRPCCGPCNYTDGAPRRRKVDASTGRV